MMLCGARSSVQRNFTFCFALARQLASTTRTTTTTTTTARATRATLLQTNASFSQRNTFHTKPRSQFFAASTIMASSSSSKSSSKMDTTEEVRPPLPKQQQELPGTTAAMDPRPDHGEESYIGSGKLRDMKAVITGGDSGIGRAVAIAYAREGADVLISYLNEDDDAKDTKTWIEKAGRKCVLVPGDISDAKHCRKIIDTAVKEFGRVDILVNNAARQDTFKELTDIPDEEWDFTFRVNMHSMFYLSKAAVPHMRPGSSIINTSSINADNPNEQLLVYATTKGAIQNFTCGLAQMLAEKNIRVNCVAPGPVWTPLIPASFDPKKVSEFGKNYPMGRPAQPKELASAYVMLASPEASYISAATIPVTGGKPFL